MRDSLDAIVISLLLEQQSDIDNIQWLPFRAGVDIFPLYKDNNSNASAALLRYQAGAYIPAHDHPGFEHIMVLHGSQRDERGVYEKGCLVINKPGSRHSVVSEYGCIVLAIWQQPVAFVK